MISVIIPFYNEKSVLINCLDSLSHQSCSDFEIILVDDGSDNKFKFNLPPNRLKFPKISLWEQNHKGPGPARNFGVSKSKGEILVFVDADMTFDCDFMEKLVRPIQDGKVKGTFTKEEYVSNWSNPWARCWNYYHNLPDALRIPANFPSESPVFRAILKSEFLKVNGFSDIGFTDDWTLARKLGYKAKDAKDAVCYHHNPDSTQEIYSQARWIGKNEFISGNVYRRLWNLMRYNAIWQFVRALFLSVRYREAYLIPFSFIYSIAVTKSILLSFLGEKKSK